MLAGRFATPPLDPARRWGRRVCARAPCIGIEAGDLTHPFGIGLVGGLGNQSDEFGVVDEDAVALGEMLDGGVDVAHGSEVEVGNVHADLGTAVGERHRWL